MLRSILDLMASCLKANSNVVSRTSTVSGAYLSYLSINYFLDSSISTHIVIGKLLIHKHFRRSTECGIFIYFLLISHTSLYLQIILLIKIFYSCICSQPCFNFTEYTNE